MSLRAKFTPGTILAAALEPAREKRRGAQTVCPACFAVLKTMQKVRENVYTPFNDYDIIDETFADIPNSGMTGMQRFRFAREEPDGGG